MPTSTSKKEISWLDVFYRFLFGFLPPEYDPKRNKKRSLRVLLKEYNGNAEGTVYKATLSRIFNFGGFEAVKAKNVSHEVFSYESISRAFIGFNQKGGNQWLDAENWVDRAWQVLKFFPYIIHNILKLVSVVPLTMTEIWLKRKSAQYYVDSSWLFVPAFVVFSIVRICSTVVGCVVHPIYQYKITKSSSPLLAAVCAVTSLAIYAAFPILLLKFAPAAITTLTSLPVVKTLTAAVLSVAKVIAPVFNAVTTSAALATQAAAISVVSTAALAVRSLWSGVKAFCSSGKKKEYNYCSESGSDASSLDHGDEEEENDSDVSRLDHGDEEEENYSDVSRTPGRSATSLPNQPNPPVSKFTCGCGFFPFCRNDDSSENNVETAGGGYYNPLS